MNLSTHSLEIADEGRVQVLDEAGLRAYHGGAALFGMTVAFRMLQYAAAIFSREDEVWDRSNLHIHSLHPGPGVRDAIEYITRCVSREAYSVGDAATACHSAMTFEWIVRHGREEICLHLRDDFIPTQFLRLLEAKNTNTASAAELQALEAVKVQMSHDLWKRPLSELFELTRRE